jgi:ADP-ribose pyrophosphatase
MTRTIINKGRLRIEERFITLPSGKHLDRIVVRPGHAVSMFPVEGDHCYLIKQYRYPIEGWILEAPAGTMDAGEEPIETAHRELIEETCMKAEELIPRGFIYTTPGFTDEIIWLFEARGLSPSDEFAPDEDEQIEVIKVPLADLAEMVHDGRIVDAKTISLAARCLGWGR